MRLSIMLLGLVSFPALAACPNLGGVYKICRSSTNQNMMTEVVVDQKIVNKYNQFTFTTKEADAEDARIEKYIADGKTKIVSDTDSDTGVTIKTETLTTCLDDVLNIKMNATLDAEAFANITIKTHKEGNRLIQVFSGTSMGDQVNDTITCE